MRNSRNRVRRSSYRKEAEELREVADDFIKAWEDLHESESDFDDYEDDD